MEQHEFRVKFSLSTKLLVSIVIILTLVIGFLSYAAIYLIQDDKKAYIYQLQLSESQMFGRDLVSKSQQSFDLLKASLASFDFEKTDEKEKGLEQEKLELESFVKNQNTLESITLFEFSQMGQVVELQKEFGPFTKNNFSVDSERIRSSLVKLLQDNPDKNFYFFNASSNPSQPKLGIAFIETLDTTKKRIALGTADYGSVLDNLRSNDLMVLTSNGHVLYDTNLERFSSNKNLSDDPFFQVAKNSNSKFFTKEFELPEGRFLSSIVKPGLDLVIINKINWLQAMGAVFDLIEKYLLLGLMAISSSIIFAILFAKRLTGPIQDLFEATKAVAQGNFNIKVKIPNHDEIGALTESFNVMSSKITELVDEKLKAAQLENELAIASTVQEKLIPKSGFQSPTIEIESHYESAEMCGGDWWGHFQVGNKHALMIADATGHGFPAALITAAARSCFSMVEKLCKDNPSLSLSPSWMLEQANNVIYESSYGQILMTFFCCVIDTDAKEITYANAAHNPPWLFRKNGETFKLISSLMPDGTRLGEVHVAEPFPEKKIPYEPGDFLALYTDGFPEGKNTSDVMYGKKRFMKLVQKELGQGSRHMIDTLVHDFKEYNTGKNFDDDITIVSVKILA